MDGRMCFISELCVSLQAFNRRQYIELYNLMFHVKQ